MTDLQALFPSLGSSTSYPESIIRAVGEILEKAVKPQNDSNAYRRLRTFSGTVPTPAGEETMEHWIEQSRIMITECDCSERKTSENCRKFKGTSTRNHKSCSSF